MFSSQRKMFYVLSIISLLTAKLKKRLFSKCANSIIFARGSTCVYQYLVQ